MQTKAISHGWRLELPRQFLAGRSLVLCLNGYSVGVNVLLVFSAEKKGDQKSEDDDGNEQENNKPGRANRCDPHGPPC